MYPEELVLPMKKQLTDHGFSELKTVDDVENMIKNSGTTLVIVNSVCGCAAANARPEIASISLDAYNCDLSPFNNLISKIRPHKGQNDVSKRILNFLKDSHIQNSSKDDVQDLYSFRCIPQVHGATLDSVNYCNHFRSKIYNGKI